MGVSGGLVQRRWLRLGVALAGAVVLLLALAQLILPAIAAKLVRDRVSRYGTIKSVRISAWPAVELLWGKAQSATVAAGQLTMTSAQLAELSKQLWEARGVEKSKITAGEVTVNLSGLRGGLSATDVLSVKQGSQLSGSATITQQALDEASPSDLHVQPVASGEGQVELRASGELFGASLSVDAFVKPVEGRLVVEPRGIPFAGLGTVTLLSDPHVKVESVALEMVPGQSSTYRLSFRASLH
jgi:hypothetical protein